MFYVEDKCIIVACKHGHQFKIGELVKITNACYANDGTGGSYTLTSLEDPSQHHWSVTDEEIELVEPDPHEIEAAIASIKSVQQ